MEVLTAFIREHSREQWLIPEHDNDPAPPRTTRPDIQAAVTVVGRRDARRDVRRINLVNVDLVDADLVGAYLGGENLRYAKVIDFIDVGRGLLTGADLRAADLSRADLTHANLRAARLTGTNLKDARIVWADLAYADLTEAKLLSARAAYATLTGADLTGADLTGADLTGAVLTGADLSGASWSRTAPVPEGWILDPGSSRLERASTGSRPAGSN
jgi:uncharacterized protein YjbI with pentapeptide repeats